MISRFCIVFAVVVATVSAQYGYKPAYAPEPYAPPKYEFSYAVNDPYTYDVKSQKESRDGDVVYGVYELLEPDGSKRVVTYEDTGYGFQAKVDKLPGGYPSYPRY
ncbi:cuticle protein 8-like [Macrosteles quadrilineatus]|uniref:cuticle protein 8-like n=1 Tax=Macrosteles quadrilineatus TaxID=74068 RepID=UPI0023E14A66|nr:cuticle protein 8-like [Macrosteles quadrilineatus]